MYKVEGIRKILHDNIYENTFISWDVQHDIESSKLKYVKYMINNKHNINMFVPLSESDLDINMIAIIISMMENLAKSENKDQPIVNLTIVFSNQKKNIYPKTKVLCCDNINSGSTYPGRSIVCWRREEFYKVLIHELFHYYSFDFHYMDSYYNKLNNMILVPKIKGTDMINEAYTESSTIIILSILQYAISKSNIDLIPFMEEFIGREILFLLFQIAKVMVVFNCNDFDLYINNKIKIYQNTSFRSYFIIKMCLLSNINDILNMMNNGLTINNQRLIEFGNIINLSWQKLSNKEIINHFIKLINDKFKDSDKKLNWIYKTCRMCVDDVLMMC
jgi:hypothetical protein